MKFKVGDRVRVRKDLEYGNFYGGVRVNDEMVNNKGKVLTIIGIDNRTYLVEGSTWFWTDEMFENKVDYTYEDLKKSPIGTKVMFENGKILIKLSDKRYDNEVYWREESDLEKMKDIVGNFGKIVKIEEPMYTTVYEYKPEILNEVEKRYLRGVIRPFEVKYIEKGATRYAEFIYIKLKKEHISLPDFEPNTMYKGMEINKKYTLEELGL